MKKTILVIPVLIFATMMIASVFAFDFSVRGNKEVKTSDSLLQVKTSVWHSDGRAPTCYRPNWCSKGIAPQGQGSVELTYEDSSILYRMNVKLDETKMVFVGNKAYGTVNSHGVEWAKNLYQAYIYDYNVNYVYDRDAQTITFGDWLGPYSGQSITVPVK